MWVYLTDRYSGAPQMVLFDYERTRLVIIPKTFWEINLKDISRAMGTRHITVERFDCYIRMLYACQKEV